MEMSQRRMDNQMGKSSTRDSRISSDRRTRVLVPCRLFGMGLLLFWGWAIQNPVMLSFRALSVAGETGGYEYISTMQLMVQLIVECLTLIICAVLFRYLTPLSSRRLVIRIGAVGMFCSTLFDAVLVSGNLPFGMTLAVFQFCASALGGFGYAIALLLWAEVYGRLDTGRVLLFGAVSLVLGSALYLFVWAMTPPMAAIATILLTFAIYPTCVASSDYVGPEPVGNLSASRYPFPVIPVTAMSVSGFATLFILSYAVSVFGDPRVPADLCIGLAVLVMLILFKSRVQPIILSNLALLLCIAGCICIAGFGEAGRTVAPYLLMVGCLLVAAFVLCMLADATYRQGVPSLRLFGFALAARAIMVRVGAEAGRAVVGIVAPESVKGEILTIAVGLLLVAMTALLWVRDRRHKGWALEGVDVGLGGHVPTAHERLEAACDKAISDYQLTPREANVLMLLLEGNTYSDVCQSLFLSINTVKTHVHHAYEKLGVHNRKEAMELLGVEDLDATGLGGRSVLESRAMPGDDSVKADVTSST